MPSGSDERRVEATAEALAVETVHTADDLAADAARKATILADALADALGKVTAQLHDQDTYNRRSAAYAKRSRAIIIALIVSFALDIAITTFLGIVSVQTSDTSNAVHQQQYQSCLTSNATRANVVKIWERNIGAFHDNAEGAAFLGLVRETYEPLDCKKLR
jgi:hypothetical protein